MTHGKVLLTTQRLIAAEFTMEMARSVHIVSLDDANRRFMPDEVFDTPEEAAETIGALMAYYQTLDGPLVYPLLLQHGEHIGHIEAVPIKEGWEIGYHIAARYAGRGFATEAVRAFVPVMMEKLSIDRIYGICVEENKASERVLEKCGFELIFKGVGAYQGQERPIRKYVYQVRP